MKFFIHFQMNTETTISDNSNHTDGYENDEKVVMNVFGKNSSTISNLKPRWKDYHGGIK